MKTLNITLVTLALASTLATSAFAHTEFRDRDGIQGATASYSPDNSSQVVVSQAPSKLSDAEAGIIIHNLNRVGQ